LVLYAIYNNFLWLAVPITLLLITNYAGSDKYNKAPAASSKGPYIRPIVIKKKYVGPASIYPSKMDMRITPHWDHHGMWQKGGKGLGRLVAAADHVVTKALKGGD